MSRFLASILLLSLLWAGPARAALDLLNGIAAQVNDAVITFEDVQGYDDIVMLREIEVESHCEHHMAPFLGKAYVAYMPTNRVVGISKLAKVVEIFARRLQTQETMTQQIADAITDSLRPAGVAVLPSALGAGELPVGALALTLGGVLVSGLVWTWLATVSALRGQLIDALRNQ